MSISIGPNPVLDDLILWYDAANTKCYSGEPTRNQISQDYRGESGLATGNASIDLSGLFGFGLISKEPFAHEVWSLDNINKGKLTRYNSFYFDGINDYLEIDDDDAFSFGQDNVSVYTSDFSSGVDGWTDVNGTAAGNIDSIGGENDNLRFTVNTVSGQHYIGYNGLVNGATYTVSFDYYIPTQSNLDGVRAGFNGDNDAFGSDVSPTLDQWNSFSGTAKMNGQTQLNIMMQDGGNDNFQDAGGDDVFYIRNVQITELKDDLPFSVSAWVKADDLSGFSIAGKYGIGNSVREYFISFNNSDKLEMDVRDTSGNSPYIIQDTAETRENEWLHIVGTYAGAGPNSTNAFAAAADGLTLYVNGIAITTTANNSSSYTGMSNTSQAFWIGRYNTIYANGHTRNVKIFNRELNAGEVYQLYYSNSLNGVKYSSDFSSGVDGWAASNGTADGNIDSIGGQDDNLRITVNTSSSTHFLYLTPPLTAGRRYRVSLDYYIPSGQSNVDGLTIGTDITAANFIEITSGTTDSWTRVDAEAVANGPMIRVFATDAGNRTFQDAGGDDVLYIRNINIVELDTNSEVDFVEEWGGAKGSLGEIDSTVGESSWTGSSVVTYNNITETANSTIAGETGTLKLEATSTTTSDTRFYVAATQPNKRGRVQFSYYIPSTNTTIDSILILHTSGSTIETFETTDSWTTVTVDYINNTGGTSIFQFRLIDGGVSNATAGDYVAIKDFSMTDLGCVADFDLSNYDDSDKITDKSPNKFIATPQGGALARDRWTPYNLSFDKDKDNNDIATITRDPSSGAFFENTDKLTFYGEHPLYVSNASTGDKVSVSFEAKSNITGLFTGLNFFNSGTSAAERVWLNRILMPDDYEYYYGTSNLIATGDDVGFSILMNRDFSSGWNSISLRKPQIELKDHATNFVGLSRTGTNAIVNLADRSQYTGTIVNDVKSSGVSKIDGVQSFAPINGAYWEFNGVDTSIDTNFDTVNFGKSLTFEVVFSVNDASSEMVFGVDNDRPLLHIRSNTARFSINTNLGQIDVDSVTSISTNTIYHAVATADEVNGTGNLYLNGEFEKGYSFSTYNIRNGNNVILGDRRSPTPSVPLNGGIYLARFYKKPLNSGEVYRNYRAVKTKYGL